MASQHTFNPDCDALLAAHYSEDESGPHVPTNLDPDHFLPGGVEQEQVKQRVEILEGNIFPCALPITLNGVVVDARTYSSSLGFL